MADMMARLGQPLSGQTTTADRPFLCEAPGCGRRFNRKFTLTEHMKTHTGAKPFVCPEPACARRFSTSGNLSRHKRLHASIKPLECSVPTCDRSFPSEAMLQRHLQIHLKGRCYTCNLAGCNKSYSTTGNLTRHIKNHHFVLEDCTMPVACVWPNSYPTALSYALTPQTQQYEPLIISVSANEDMVRTVTPATTPCRSVTNTTTPCASEPIPSPVSTSEMVDFLRLAFLIDEETHQPPETLLLDCAASAIIDDVVKFELAQGSTS